MCTREKDPEGPRSLAHGSYSCRCRLGIKVFRITSTSARARRDGRVSGVRVFLFTRNRGLCSPVCWLTGFTSQEPCRTRVAAFCEIEGLREQRRDASAEVSSLERYLLTRGVAYASLSLSLSLSLYAQFARIYLLSQNARPISLFVSSSLSELFSLLSSFFFLFLLFLPFFFSFFKVPTRWVTRCSPWQKRTVRVYDSRERSPPPSFHPLNLSVSTRLYRASRNS